VLFEPNRDKAMQAYLRAADSTDAPEVKVFTANRERFYRRVANAVTAIAAFIAVLVASAISVLLGFFA